MEDDIGPAIVASKSLSELRKLAEERIARLDPPVVEAFRRERARASERFANRVASVLAEFKLPFSAGSLIHSIEYELAFRFDWYQGHPALYNARHWINEYDAGVYFIYDASDRLSYVGSSYRVLGKRIWASPHKQDRECVDVVLFDRPVCHFVLALEAFVISRLKPPKNGTFRTLNIPPLPDRKPDRAGACEAKPDAPSNPDGVGR